MKIKSFSQCSDWYFVFVDPQGKTINYHLAGFALIEGENDRVVGMVPVAGGAKTK